MLRRASRAPLGAAATAAAAVDGVEAAEGAAAAGDADRLWLEPIASRSREPPNEISDRQQAIEERPIALERHAQVLGRDVAAAGPLALEIGPRSGERFRQALDGLGHQPIRFLDGVPRLVDELRLDLVPAVAKLITFLIGKQRRLGLALVGTAPALLVLAALRMFGRVLQILRRSSRSTGNLLGSQLLVSLALVHGPFLSPASFAEVLHRPCHGRDLGSAGLGAAGDPRRV